VRQALLAVVVLLVLSGCGGGGKSSKSTTVISTTVVTTTTTASSTTSGGTKVVTHGRYHYPDVLVTNYMKSCVAGGNAKKRAYCACTLDKLSNNVSTRDFAEIGLSKTIPPRIKKFMSQAVADCASKL
jgi:uncharacterized protein YceK